MRRGPAALVWWGLGLQPQRVDTCKVSNDPQFENELIDVVASYLSPPETADALCMDERSQIQAPLPIVPGPTGTMIHDYKRNGTATLFSALDVLSGAVIGQRLSRRQHTEFIKFLNTIDGEVPDGLRFHLILDNYATHQHAEVDRWLKRHKWFHLHSVPTSSVVAQPRGRLGERPDRQKPTPRHHRQRARVDCRHRAMPQRRSVKKTNASGCRSHRSSSEAIERRGHERRGPIAAALNNASGGEVRD